MKDNRSMTDDHARSEDKGTESRHQIVEDPHIPSVELQFEKLELECSGGVIPNCASNDVSEEGGEDIYTDHCTSLEPNEKCLRAKEVSEEPNISDLTQQVTGSLFEDHRKPRQKKKKKGNKSVSHTSIAVAPASKQEPGQNVLSLRTGRSCNQGGNEGGSTGNGELHCKNKSTAGDSEKDTQGKFVGLNQNLPLTEGSQGSMLTRLQGAPAGDSNVFLKNEEQLICQAHQSSLRDADWEVVFSSSCNQMSERSQLNIVSLSTPALSGWDQEADGWDDVLGEALADNMLQPGYGNGTSSPREPKAIGTGSLITVVCATNALLEYSPSDRGWETVKRSKGKAVRTQQQDELQQHTGRGKFLNLKMQNQTKVVEIGAQSTVDLKFDERRLAGTAIPDGQAWGNVRQQKHASSTCVLGRDKSDNIPKDHGHPSLCKIESLKQGISSYKDAADSTSLSRNDFLMPCAKVDTATVLQSLLPAERDESSDEQHGCISGAPIGSIPCLRAEDGSDYEASNQSDNKYSDLDDLDDFSDDILSDDCDSDVSQQSHETLKKWRCFQVFFQDLESLSIDQIKEHDRQWHCPVCQGGVGAVDWYRGFEPLVAHAQTMKSRRVKLHRIFKKVLEEELRQIGLGASAIDERPFGGKWHGLDVDDESQNPLIVWPPMVIVQNTQLEMDDQEKVTNPIFCTFCT